MVWGFDEVSGWGPDLSALRRRMRARRLIAVQWMRPSARDQHLLVMMVLVVEVSFGAAHCPCLLAEGAMVVE